MIITKKWLQEHNSCQEGVDYWKKNNIKSIGVIDLINILIKENRLDWSNWIISRYLNYKQRIQYAVFAAEKVIDIFEKKHPEDDRPRKAIEAAKKCIESPTEENKRNAAVYATNAAYVAADAVYAAAYATNAAYVAADAVNVANAAAYAANAAYSADAAKKEMLVKIINYGKSLIKEMG